MDNAFTFSDLVTGYVTGYDTTNSKVSLKTLDGRETSIRVAPNAYARFVSNLGENYQDANGATRSLLALNRQLLFAYGTYYPANGVNGHAKGHSAAGHGSGAATVTNDAGNFIAQWLVFPGRGPGAYRQEEPDWWINQSRSIGRSYLKWQFNHPPEQIDYKNYRTMLNLSGDKHGDYLQETDTISRMIYGLSAGYMLTGEESFLEAAEKGTQYLRDHMRFYDVDNDIVYWHHGLKSQGEKDLKLLTSEFGDDHYSIPIYEQIYALCGPTMTYRLTGDKKILDDIHKTMSLFKHFYRDNGKGGYFSHLDPVSLDSRAESLGHNRAKKNWNSVGDHAPAYLINLYLATGSLEHAEFLEETFDTIVKYFPDYDHSPFVQERFYEDWSHDKTWGWQQNRSVVGHNLKIAWNLMRMMSLKPKDEYVAMARKIAELMPAAGSDRQRGGWYDVVEREIKDGSQYRFVWHDRKAWWQQEQAILAYLILYGVLRDDEYLKLARETASFYNAFFLDHDDGGIYFNVLANGLPYLLGTERFKGSHSMSAYHSMELCFLAAVYTNLLITKEPLWLHFKPFPKSFPNDILRVAPDLLPPGSVHIEQCWIDGQVHTDFDAKNLAVHLPATDKRVSVRVKISPAPWTNRKDS